MTGLLQPALLWLQLLCHPTMRAGVATPAALAPIDDGCCSARLTCRAQLRQVALLQGPAARLLWLWLLQLLCHQTTTWRLLLLLLLLSIKPQSCRPMCVSLLPPLLLLLHSKELAVCLAA